MNVVKKWLLISALFGFIGTAQSAVILSLDPSDNVIDITETVTVDVNIEGLGDFEPISLSSYFIEVIFDESVLSLDNVQFTNFLGDEFFGEVLLSSSPGTGVVLLDAFSLLFDFELDLIQPSDFTLASLTFSGIAYGDSDVSFSFIELTAEDSNDPFNPIFLVPDSVNATNIEVASPIANPVSAPSALLFVLFAVASIYMRKMKR